MYRRTKCILYAVALSYRFHVLNRLINFRGIWSQFQGFASFQDSSHDAGYIFSLIRDETSLVWSRRQGSTSSCVVTGCVPSRWHRSSLGSSMEAWPCTAHTRGNGSRGGYSEAEKARNGQGETDYRWIRMYV